MDKVIVYKSDILPYSETFIKEQILSLKKWNGILVGKRLIKDGLSLKGLSIDLIEKDRLYFFSKLVEKYNFLMKHISDYEFYKLKSHRAKLIHVHFATEAVRIWPTVKKLGLPMVVTLHGNDINVYREWWESGNAGFIMRRYPQRLLELASERDVHFIAVSNAIRDRAIEYGIPDEKIAVHYIGIDCERFIPSGLAITQRKQRILYVGRLVEKKGAGYLLQAFAKVANRIPNAELVIVGDGPLRTLLEEQANQLRLNVSFLGALSSVQVQQQLHEARVFCLPSVTAENGDAEGLGIVILEAQACGVPVVTSARGGAAEGILDGVTGFSFPEKDVSILAERLFILLQDDRLINDMSLAAVEFIKDNFDIKKCTKSLENYYDLKSMA
ncbi:glycosyltransferase [Aeromonas caviae]|uniref:glycosyltransferase n=1 Tax=Aeromonas caviae TaxID=648 RepID=UPI003F74A610